MPRDARSNGDDLDAVLADLPANFVVRALPDARFVAGPPGLSVVAAAPGEPDERSDPGAGRLDLAQLAGDIRAVLADHFTLVPFVQPLLMTNGRPADGHSRAASVPSDLLLDVLVRGRPVLDDSSLAHIAAIAAAGHLDAVGPHHRAAMRGWVGAGPVD